VTPRLASVGLGDLQADGTWDGFAGSAPLAGSTGANGRVATGVTPGRTGRRANLLTGRGAHQLTAAGTAPSEPVGPGRGAHGPQGGSPHVPPDHAAATPPVPALVAVATFRRRACWPASPPSRFARRGWGDLHVERDHVGVDGQVALQGHNCDLDDLVSERVLKRNVLWRWGCALRSHRRMARSFSERTILQHVMDSPPAYSLVFTCILIYN